MCNPRLWHTAAGDSGIRIEGGGTTGYSRLILSSGVQNTSNIYADHGNNELNIAAAQVLHFKMTSTNCEFNPQAADIDFQVKGDTDVALLYCNAGQDNVVRASNPSL